MSRGWEHGVGVCVHVFVWEHSVVCFVCIERLCVAWGGIICVLHDGVTLHVGVGCMRRDCQTVMPVLTKTPPVLIQPDTYCM